MFRGKKSLELHEGPGTKETGWIPSPFFLLLPSTPPPPKKSLVKKGHYASEKKNMMRRPVPFLWRAVRWRMKKPLVSVIGPQWPFMRGIRYAKSLCTIHRCPPQQAGNRTIQISLSWSWITKVFLNWLFRCFFSLWKEGEKRKIV